MGVRLFDQDIFVNVAGGVHVDEPAVDLGVIAAVASSHKEKSSIRGRSFSAKWAWLEKFAASLRPKPASKRQES